ncbi:MAG: hypothetical protein U5K99_04290 [Anaerolineales bacterium]|nr:hypothetical protein [Anaerolineales bacterium]
MINHRKKQKSLLSAIDLFKFFDKGIDFVIFLEAFAGEIKYGERIRDLGAIHHDIDGLRLVPVGGGPSDAWELQVQLKLRDPAQDWQEWQYQEGGNFIKREWVAAYRFRDMDKDKARFYQFALPARGQFTKAGSLPGATPALPRKSWSWPRSRPTTRNLSPAGKTSSGIMFLYPIDNPRINNHPLTLPPPGNGFISPFKEDPMPPRYDKKGKLFTEKITKDRVKVTIQTAVNRISGHLHVPPDERMKDDLNNSRGFLAITQGRVLSPDDQELTTFDFLAVNKEQIIWVIEEEEREPEPTPGEEL